MSTMRYCGPAGVDPIEFLVRLARAPNPAAISFFG